MSVAVFALSFHKNKKKCLLSRKVNKSNKTMQLVATLLKERSSLMFPKHEI